MNNYYESLTHLHKIPSQNNEDLDSMLCRVRVEIAYINTLPAAVDHNNYHIDCPVMVRCKKFKRAVEEEIANRVLLEDYETKI